MKTVLQKILFTVLFIVISSSVVFSQWTDDPNVNIILAKLRNQVKYPVVLNNNSGGCITVLTVDTGTDDMMDFDIYAQSYNAAGEKLWAADVPVVTLPKIQRYPQITSDGAGGAIITWLDNRNPDNTMVRENIYVQRIDANGNLKWNVNGIQISNTSAGKTSPQIICDGAGGAVILWTDSPEEAPVGVYGQRIDANGNKLWGPDEILIQPDMALLKIITDSMGGIILTGIKVKSSIDGYPDLYSQKINFSGQVQWTGEAIPICTAKREQNNLLTSVSDGTGGIIYIWKDLRNFPNPVGNIYAQRVNSSGVIQWNTNGIPILSSGHSDNFYLSALCNNSGIIIIFNNNVYSSPLSQRREDILGLKLSFSGLSLWGETPKVICSFVENQIHPLILPDGENGAIICWKDYRYFSPSTDIYAQRITSDGNLLWDETGLNISKESFIDITFPYSQIVMETGTIQKITWQSRQTSKYLNIDLSTNDGGSWIPISKNEPDDGIFDNWVVPDLPSGRCKIRIKDANETGPSGMSIGGFQIQGLMRYPVEGVKWISGSNQIIKWNRNAIPDRRINIELSTDGGNTWKQIQNNVVNDGDCHIPNIPNYPSDKCRLKVTSQYRLYYLISSGFFTIESPVITITSPAGGEVWKVGGDAVMKWKSNCGSKLVNIDLSTDGGTSWIHLRKDLPDDGDWHIYKIPNLPSTKCKIRISDIYGYASAISNGYFTITKSRGKLSADNDESVQIPTEFALDQNYPNPFNPVTVISYQLPVFSHATLKVYDVLGKEVATLVNEEKAPGYYEIIFDAGKFNLSSGFYFYRISAGNYNSTKKLLLMK